MSEDDDSLSGLGFEYGQLNLVDQIQSIARLSGLSPSAVNVLAFGTTKGIQKFHLGDNKGFQQGEPKYYAESFGERVPKLHMPASPSDVWLFVMEPREEDGHALKAAMTALYAMRSAWGKDHATSINRLIYMSGKDTIKPTSSYVLDNPQPPYPPYPNLVREEERKFYCHPIIVLSSSHRGVDSPLHSAEDLAELEKKYAAYYSQGGNSRIVPLVSVGNDGDDRFLRSHNAIYYHPDGMQVGSADIERRIGPDGKEHDYYYLESGSAVGPSVIAPITPKYRTVEENYNRFKGSSAATPMLAGGTVAPLLAAYATVEVQHDDKVLDIPDIPAAVKQTAHPIFVARNTSVDSCWVTPNDQVGPHYQSEDAGPGMVQPLEAEKLLQAREAYARTHPDSVKKLVDSSFAIEPIIPSQSGDNTLFRYRITVPNDVLTNVITFNLHSTGFKDREDKIFLTAPDGTSRMRILPSVGENPDTGYRIARADGFITIPAKGEWVLESTHPIQKGTFNLKRAIPRGHYIDMVKPDYVAMRRNAMHHTDLSKVKPSRIDALPLHRFDLTETILPNGYLKLRLAQAVMKRDKTQVQGLLESGHAEIAPFRKALEQAAERNDAAAILKIMDKGNPDFNTFKAVALSGDKALVLLMLENGYAGIRDPQSGKSTEMLLIPESKPTPPQDAAFPANPFIQLPSVSSAVLSNQSATKRPPVR